jgi:hypothetical protein
MFCPRSGRFQLTGGQAAEELKGVVFRAARPTIATASPDRS